MSLTPVTTPLNEDPIFAAFAKRNNLEQESFEVTLYGDEIFEFKKIKSYAEMQANDKAVIDFAEAYALGNVGPVLEAHKELLDFDPEVGMVVAYLNSTHTRRWEVEREIKLDDKNQPYEEITRTEVPPFKAQHWLMLKEADGHAFKEISKAVSRINGTQINAELNTRYEESKKDSTATTSDSD